jgi:energy-converting hydrogenase Eha subunit H
MDNKRLLKHPVLIVLVTLAINGLVIWIGGALDFHPLDAINSYLKEFVLFATSVSIVVFSITYAVTKRPDKSTEKEKKVLEDEREKLAKKLDELEREDEEIKRLRAIVRHKKAVQEK